MSILQSDILRSDQSDLTSRSMAPFPMPPGKTAKPGPWREVKVNDLSDGDPKTWPRDPRANPVSESHYRLSLADFWAQKQEHHSALTNYYLDRLPGGYRLYAIARGTDQEPYKRLFGHPTGRYYDSAVRFSVHFAWLQDDMPGNCTCVLCSGKKPAPIPRFKPKPPPAAVEKVEKLRMPRLTNITRDDSGSRSDSATRQERDRRQRTFEAMPNTDEEGTEDVYKVLLLKLKKQGNTSRRTFEIDIHEKDSMDWRAERKSMAQHLSSLSLQHSFVPRLGELVLWCPYWPEELDLVLNPETGQYQFYSAEQEQFLRFPDWHGGVIAATPANFATDGAVDFPDILSNPKKRNAYNASGFRIETFPDPNNDVEKSLSKQYRYVPLRQIRPMSHWQTLLRGIPERRLHPSFRYALTCMTTISLIERFQITADWPEASIHCKGVYLGAEFLVTGDAVRILPKQSPSTPQQNSKGSPAPPKKAECTDILIISSIRLNLHNITDAHLLPTSRTLSTSSSITLVGTAYTLDPKRAYDYSASLVTEEATGRATVIEHQNPLPHEDMKSLLPIVGAKAYGPWYRLHPVPGKQYEISFDRVLGRLREPDALKLWLGMAQTNPPPGTPTPKPTLGHDMPAILAGRRYATATDERIPHAPTDSIRFFWADTRVQALSLETLNGYEVGAYDECRDRESLKSWRAMLRVVDGVASQQDLKDGNFPKRKGRPPGTKVVDGKLVRVKQDTGETDEDEVMMAGGGMKVDRQAPGTAVKLPSSQMAGAAMDIASLDSSSDSNEDSDGRQMLTSDVNPTQQQQQQGKQKARKHAGTGKFVPRPQAQPLTKAHIMSSVEGGAGYDGLVDEDEAILEELRHIPPARGGTEESEGGDYKGGDKL